MLLCINLTLHWPWKLILVLSMPLLLVWLRTDSQEKTVTAGVFRS